MYGIILISIWIPLFLFIFVGRDASPCLRFENEYKNIIIFFMYQVIALYEIFLTVGLEFILFGVEKIKKV